MAGAMRMGELVHGIESRIIQATRHGAAPASAFLDDLDVFFDRALTMIDDLVRIDRGEAVAEEEPSAAARSDAAVKLALAEIQPGASLPVLPSVAQVADAVALAGAG